MTIEVYDLLRNLPDTTVKLRTRDLITLVQHVSFAKDLLNKGAASLLGDIKILKPDHQYAVDSLESALNLIDWLMPHVGGKE